MWVEGCELGIELSAANDDKLGCKLGEARGWVKRCAVGIELGATNGNKLGDKLGKDES